MNTKFDRGWRIKALVVLGALESKRYLDVFEELPYLRLRKTEHNPSQ